MQLPCCSAFLGPLLLLNVAGSMWLDLSYSAVAILTGQTGVRVHPFVRAIESSKGLLVDWLLVDSPPLCQGPPSPCFTSRCFLLLPALINRCCCYQAALTMGAAAPRVLLLLLLLLLPVSTAIAAGAAAAAASL